MGASLLVFSNKTDIDGCMGDDEIRNVLLLNLRGRAVANAGKALQLDAIKTHKWTIFQCSAITGKHLNDGIDWVVEDAKERLFLY